MSSIFSTISPAANDILGESWSTRNTYPAIERLSQLRKRSHEDDAAPQVEVVVVHQSATCATRSDVHTGFCDVINLLLLSLLLLCVLLILYLADVQLLDLYGAHVKRVHAAQRSREESEFSKQLWADVMRRRLQEQPAVGRATQTQRVTVLRATAEVVPVAMASAADGLDDSSQKNKTNFSAPSKPVPAGPKLTTHVSKPAAHNKTATHPLSSLRVPPKGHTRGENDN